MELIPTPLPDIKLLSPRVFGDERGYFLESWNRETLSSAGIDFSFVQDNHSRSKRNVMRGLHYQLPGAQGKLVRVTNGAVFDVVVDLRRSSPDFGRWYGVELSAENKRMLWVPPGFAHGFLALADDTDFLYKCTAPYQPQSEHCLLWNDPAIGIKWPVASGAALLSSKDGQGKLLSEAAVFP
jgi:dTDP-4-dehydrorhamnose 3,5-epimerase